MHRDITDRVMNQVMTPFQQQFGKPCLCRATLSVCEKVCLCRGIWRILFGAVDQYPKWWPVIWFPLSLNDHHTSPCGNDQQNFSTTFDHVWPQEGPGDEAILASVCIWTQQCWHETMSQSMCFVVGMISGKILFSDECVVYFSSLSWNVFWG